MARGLRVFVEGGIYHVYNRFASGEPVFADPEEAREFIELLRYVKQRDAWTMKPFCGAMRTWMRKWPAVNGDFP
jgi:hypothetical protein